MRLPIYDRSKSMRFILALGLLIALGTSADAATLRHARTWHHISPRVASSFAAVPGWGTERLSPSVRYDDTPSYNDPSKFGGSAALPVN
jgi:hypothetical protein